MSSYAYEFPCGPREAFRMMAKGRGGPHHRHDHGPGGGGFRGDPRDFGPGFGGPGFGGPGFGGPRGPFGGGRGGGGRRRRGDVRIALLMLLAEERSGGRWRPSPGSVYPALSQLEDEGFVHSVEQDSGRAFEITETGRTHVGEREGQPAPWESNDGPPMHKLHELRTLVPGIGQAVWQVAQVGDEAQWTRATEILEETRRKLYGILAEETDPVDDEE